MELLEKFAAVTVQADNRITQIDKEYCEQHQKAYEAAISSFKELAYFWEDMNRVQQELLGDKTSPLFYNYLQSREGPSISQVSIERHIAALHVDFIVHLVGYFNRTYHVSVNPSEVADTLLPEKPADRWREEANKAYQAQMQSLIVRFQDVVDQIILRLDGRSFSEQAFYELFSKCHRAAWNDSTQKPKFERKKDTLSFSGYFCRFREWPFDGWEICDGMKEILYGLAHYETDSYRVFPVGFSDLLGYSEIKEPLVEFPSCEKVKQIKLFKNNRVDLKFRSPEYAEQFVSKYLGTVS